MCVLCGAKTRGSGFIDSLFYWRPKARVYMYNIIDEDRLRMVMATLCENDFMWTVKNSDAAQAIINSKIGV